MSVKHFFLWPHGIMISFNWVSNVVGCVRRSVTCNETLVTVMVRMAIMVITTLIYPMASLLTLGTLLVLAKITETAGKAEMVIQLEWL